MEKIKDFEGYIQRMKNGMDDKLWWVPHSNHTTIVDYGCADGALLKHIREIHPDYRLIGVDINPDMLEIAQSTVPDATFMTVKEFFDCNVDFSNAILILSSVIHEIYSYDNNAESTMLKLMTMGFNAIAIRDMMVSEYTEAEIVHKKVLEKLIQKTSKKQMDDFVMYWGCPVSIKQFLHYILKYRYLDNWDREVRENYLPINLEKFIKMVSYFYDIKYQEHYILPFIQEQTKKDFGIELKDNTHIKMLLVNKTR